MSAAVSGRARVGGFERARRFVLSAAVALTLVAGCRAPAQYAGGADDETPAVLVKPTAEVRAELERVISAALNGAPVTLAEQSFTLESHIAVERAPAADPHGLPAQGRELGRPHQFKLVTQDSRCILVHENSGRRWPLMQATCKPAG